MVINQSVSLMPSLTIKRCISISGQGYRAINSLFSFPWCSVFLQLYEDQKSLMTVLIYLNPCYIPMLCFFFIPANIVGLCKNNSIKNRCICVAQVGSKEFYLKGRKVAVTTIFFFCWFTIRVCK